jgi:teichuronic acid biosynthesis glycosyltransferase TuaG
MPIYNGIEFIDDSVESIINQTYPHWELIIGINGHSENSDVYQKAKKYETIDTRIKVHDFHQTKGKSETLNQMLSYCKYDWVSLLDVDDIWLHSKLESQLSYMSNYDVIGTKCQYFGNMNAIPDIPTGDLKHFDFLQVNPIINSSCLLKKELCHWDGSLNLEDYDLWLRLWKQGKNFYNVEYIQVLHRIHSNSAFNSKGNSSKINILKQNYA